MSLNYEAVCKELADENRFLREKINDLQAIIHSKDVYHHDGQPVRALFANVVMKKINNHLKEKI